MNVSAGLFPQTLCANLIHFKLCEIDFDGCHKCTAKLLSPCKNLCKKNKQASRATWSAAAAAAVGNAIGQFDGFKVMSSMPGHRVGGRERERSETAARPVGQGKLSPAHITFDHFRLLATTFGHLQAK